jgi:hypothetical protein
LRMFCLLMLVILSTWFITCLINGVNCRNQKSKRGCVKEVSWWRRWCGSSSVQLEAGRCYVKELPIHSLHKECLCVGTVVWWETLWGSVLNFCCYFLFLVFVVRVTSAGCGRRVVDRLIVWLRTL